jgi:hypothetical protein
MEEKIINLITEKGPMTGSEILESVDFDPLHVWRFCRLSHELAIRIIGTRYLRFDRRIDGFARISPSLMREFLTYSIIGLSKDPDPIEDKADTVLSHIEEVSRSKSDLAYNVVSTLAGRLSNEDLIKNHTCFLIAGDIVFNMAHDVPRPERSTGKMVKGSDMDIVVVVDDKFPERLMERLDEEIYQEKYRLLLNPYMNEEIDYIVKTLDRVREQVGFDNFRHMVACKIMHEGTLLYGSDRLFYIIKTMLRESGVVDRINSLEREAMSFRDKAVKYLISEDLEKIRKESLDLFYPAEESEEFE